MISNKLFPSFQLLLFRRLLLSYGCILLISHEGKSSLGFSFCSHSPGAPPPGSFVLITWLSPSFLLFCVNRAHPYLFAPGWVLLEVTGEHFLFSEQEGWWWAFWVWKGNWGASCSSGRAGRRQAGSTRPHPTVSPSRSLSAFIYLEKWFIQLHLCGTNCHFWSTVLVLSGAGRAVPKAF